MVQRETFGSYIANSVIWKLDHYTIINCCTWCCWFYLLVEIVVKPNQSKTDISNNKNTKFEKLLTMTRVYNFVEYCRFYLSFSNYRPKSGMWCLTLYTYEVDQTSGRIIILLKRLRLHIFDKIWNSKLMMTSLLTTRLGRKIHKNSMGKQKKNHATDCCLQVLKTFFL